ncbi:MAG: RNA polymerase sigma factor [Planctomycetota bacterium]|nr:RNA polymerase sigma factor [Planctomycetota bacterium]
MPATSMTSTHDNRADLQAAAGPGADLVAWVGRHQRAAWRYLRFLQVDADLVEDLLQDALLAAVAEGLPERPDAVARAWLRTTIRNLWLMELRRRQRRPPLGPLTDHALADAAVESFAVEDGSGDCVVAHLRVCLEQLGPRARQAVQRRYGDGASRTEIAAELGLGTEGAKTLLRRAREQLGTCIENRKESS